jgi:short-subunit dehydrogenase
MELANRIVIITGASSGIGEALARRFAAEGAKVVLAARSAQKLAALAAELGEERVLVVPTDVADSGQCARLVKRTVERFGGVDVLVNNAGRGLYGHLMETDWEHSREMWEVNFFGLLRLTRAALPYLKERRGMVVNISSVAGKVALPYMGEYCASKFALNAFSNALRMELAATGVRVAVVCPGRVKTRFHASAYREGQLPGVYGFGRRRYEGVSAEQVARATLGAVRGGRREVIVPWFLRLFVGFRALFPGITDAMLVRIFR